MGEAVSDGYTIVAKFCFYERLSGQHQDNRHNDDADDGDEYDNDDELKEATSEPSETTEPHLTDLCQS